MIVDTEYLWTLWSKLCVFGRKVPVYLLETVKCLDTRHWASSLPLRSETVRRPLTNSTWHHASAWKQTKFHFIPSFLVWGVQPIFRILCIISRAQPWFSKGGPSPRLPFNCKRTPCHAVHCAHKLTTTRVELLDASLENGFFSTWRSWSGLHLGLLFGWQWPATNQSA